MAREYAQIKLSIWSDDDWRDLTPEARYLYFTLLTSPTLSHCGVADWRPSRIGRLNGMSPDDIETAGAEMVDSLHLVIDHESEEVLIRSYIRNDGLMKQPKMAVAMATAHAGLASPELRGVIVHELNRLRQDYPDLAGWRSEKASDLLTMRAINPSTYPLGKGFGKGKSEPSGEGSGKGSPTPAPTPAPTSSNLSDEAPESTGKARNTDESVEFVEFYEQVYPRKEGRGHARKAWKAATKKATAEDILAGARAFAATTANTERRFIALPATWLNGERWADQLATPRRPAADPDAWMRQGPGVLDGRGL